MRKIILMLSLLVIGMFLVGCVETAEETGEEVDDDSALAGAARLQKVKTNQIPQGAIDIALYPDWEGEYKSGCNYIDVDWTKYNVENFKPNEYCQSYGYLNSIFVNLWHVVNKHSSSNCQGKVIDEDRYVSTEDSTSLSSVSNFNKCESVPGADGSIKYVTSLTGTLCCS
jgi:hypothetical protein